MTKIKQCEVYGVRGAITLLLFLLQLHEIVVYSKAYKTFATESRF